MDARKASWIVAVGLLAVARPALGLGVLADERSVGFSGVSGSAGAPADFLAPFQASVRGASQTSSFTLHPDGLGLDGSATGRGGGVSDFIGGELIFVGSGQSRLPVTFRIHGEGQVSLDGDMASFGLDGGGVRVSLLSGEEVIFVSANPFGPEGHDFSFAAPLDAGDYTLEAHALGSLDNFLEFQLAFEVRDSAVPIPEPATALALALGLGGVAAARGRGADACMTTT